MSATMRSDTIYQSTFARSCIFPFKMSIIQTVTSTKAKVNITLFQFILKKDAVVNISKGTSDITPNNSRYSRYFLRLRLLKYPSTTKKQKSGNAILPMMSKRLLTKARNPRFEVRYG